MDLRLLALLGLACVPPVTSDVVDAPLDDTEDSEASDTVVDTDDTEPGVTDDTEITPVDAPATVEVRVCADPAARAIAPLQHERIGPDPDVRTTGYSGSGTGVADLDGDGVAELLVPGAAPLTVWRLTAEGWAEVPGLLPDVPTRNALGVWPVDIDGDGDLDLHLPRFGRTDTVLENDGTGHFVVRLDTGLDGNQDRSTSAAWSDLDGDGDLDVVVGAYGLDPVGTRLIGSPDPTRVLIQGPAWTFTDVAATFGEAFQEGWVYHVAVQDLDDDGRPEVVSLRDFGQYGQRNAVLWNRPGGLEAGDGTSGIEVPSTAMGAGFGDLDGDGRVDLAISGFDSTQLLAQRAGGWFDVAAAVGFLPDRSRLQTVSWGVELLDVDHDGDMDVSATFGPWRQQDGRQPGSEEGVVNLDVQPDGLWLAGEGGALTDVAPVWGFGAGASRGLLAHDVDADGWLDLVVRELDGPVHLFRQRCGEAPSVVVEPALDVPAALAPGARVTVRAGDRTWVRWWSLGGSGCCGGATPQAHVGLGDAAGPVEIEVRWRDGRTSTVRDVPLRSRVRVGLPLP